MHSPGAAVLPQSFCQLGGWESSRAGETILGTTFPFSCVCKSWFCFLEEAGDFIPTPSTTMSIPVLCTHFLCVWNFTCPASVLFPGSRTAGAQTIQMSGHIRHAEQYMTISFQQVVSSAWCQDRGCVWEALNSPCRALRGWCEALAWLL